MTVEDFTSVAELMTKIEQGKTFKENKWEDCYTLYTRSGNLEIIILIRDG